MASRRSSTHDSMDRIVGLRPQAGATHRRTKTCWCSLLTASPPSAIASTSPDSSICSMSSSPFTDPPPRQPALVCRGRARDHVARARVQPEHLGQPAGASQLAKAQRPSRTTRSSRGCRIGQFKALPCIRITSTCSWGQPGYQSRTIKIPSLPPPFPHACVFFCSHQVSFFTARALGPVCEWGDLRDCAALRGR